jgi:F-type H+-transporting ATPase subunit c
MKSLITVLIMLIATLGPSLVIAAVGYASIMALGRNPSSSPKIMLAMIISLIFAEAIAVIALLVVFQLFTPQG